MSNKILPYHTIYVPIDLSLLFNYYSIYVFLIYGRPTIKHKYAENSIRYGLIRQLNSEVTWASTVEIKNMVFTTPYPRFKTSIKNRIIDSYKEHCVKRTEDCFVCTRLRFF